MAEIITPEQLLQQLQAHGLEQADLSEAAAGLQTGVQFVHTSDQFKELAKQLTVEIGEKAPTLSPVINYNLPEPS